MPKLCGPVTSPPNDFHKVATEHQGVTEYDVANLKGLNVSEGARAPIGLEAPQSREDLTAQAQAMS